MKVQKMVAMMHFTDEAIVDYYIGSPEYQAAAAKRIEARQDLARRMWMAEPLWRRAWMRVEYRYWPRLLGLFRS